MNITPSATPSEGLIARLDAAIRARKKMTSELYQIVLEGRASIGLLRGFVLHRYPIKSLWTRNILGIASRIDDYALRRELVENIYEEETGAISKSRRHLDSFADFGRSLGLTDGDIQGAPILEETVAVMQHNLQACNGSAHFTEGVASVLLLMEGQPAITNANGRSMEWVMRTVYRLPRSGYEYFTHHASSDGSDAVSALEEDHSSTARAILRKYCNTSELQQAAERALARAVELRHRHFDAIVRHCHVPSAAPFRGPGHGSS